MNREYIIFNPPEDIVSKQTKTKKDTEVLYNWYVGELEPRVTYMLDFIGYKLTGQLESDLVSVGNIINKILISDFQFRERDPIYNQITGELWSEWNLSDKGICLAHDFARLIVKLIIIERPDIEFIIGTGKRNSSHKGIPILKGLKGEWSVFAIQVEFRWIIKEAKNENWSWYFRNILQKL